MPKIARTRLFTTFLFFFVICSPQSYSNPIDREQWAKMRESHRTCVNSCEESEKACRLADKLLSKYPNDVKVLFFAAKVNELSGNYARAIEALREIIEKHPDQASPSLTIPAALTAKFYSATLLRHEGAFAEAQEIYSEMLKGKRQLREGKEFLDVLANMYLGEIYGDHFKNSKRAKEYFTRASDPPTEKLSPDWSKLVALYAKWADFKLRTVRENGQFSSLKDSEVQNKLDMAVILTTLHLTCNGALIEPVVWMYNDRGTLLIEKILRKMSFSQASKIDSAAASLSLGDIYEKSGRHEQALEIYSHLFRLESFFAPEGGIFATRCLYKMGKKEDGRKILDQVRKRFPNYKQVADKLEESWQKGIY